MSWSRRMRLYCQRVKRRVFELVLHTFGLDYPADWSQTLMMPRLQRPFLMLHSQRRSFPFNALCKIHALFVLSSCHFNLLACRVHCWYPQNVVTPVIRTLALSSSNAVSFSSLYRPWLPSITHPPRPHDLLSRSIHAKNWIRHTWSGPLPSFLLPCHQSILLLPSSECSCMNRHWWVCRGTPVPISGGQWHRCRH